MESKITYMRFDCVSSVIIESRLVPNPIAVKFVVIEHELGRCNTLQPQDSLLLDDLLDEMGIQILDVSPVSESDMPKPYSHRTLRR